MFMFLILVLLSFGTVKKSLQPKSATLSSTHCNKLDGRQTALQVKGKMCASDVGVNCTFKEIRQNKQSV